MNWTPVIELLFKLLFLLILQLSASPSRPPKSPSRLTSRHLQPTPSNFVYYVLLQHHLLTRLNLASTISSNSVFDNCELFLSFQESSTSSMLVSLSFACTQNNFLLQANFYSFFVLPFGHSVHLRYSIPVSSGRSYSAKGHSLGPEGFNLPSGIEGGLNQGLLCSCPSVSQVDSQSDCLPDISVSLTVTEMLGNATIRTIIS